MITCPWCGTSYVEFQSNCKNCGGPLPPPVQTEHPAGGGTPDQAPYPPPAPPPPPRTISSAYTWRLMATDGLSIAAGVLAMVGFIFGIVGLGLTAGIITAFVGLPFALLGLVLLGGGMVLGYQRYQEKHKIVTVLQSGQTTRGQVLAVDENLSVAINNRHPWTIRYGFVYNGQSWEGTVSTLNTPGPALAPGQPAWVLYMPDSPDQNAIYPHP